MLFDETGLAAGLKAGAGTREYGGGENVKTILKIIGVLLGIIALFYLGLLITAWI